MNEGAVVWLTGLPSSGKSTLAVEIAAALRRRGDAPIVLDGDEIRGCVAPPHGYDAPGRADFYETLARLAATISRQGVTVIVAATASRAAFRARARALAGRFVEVYVDVPLEVCVTRDAKGLYAQREANLPGLDVRYEAPAAPEVVTHGDRAADVAAVLRALHALG